MSEPSPDLDPVMRRPPQLWEERLSRTTSTLAVGLSSGATSLVTTSPATPGNAVGVEPSPVLPPPEDFIKPSTPQLLGGIQGINVLWDGLNADSELWPFDTSWVEVHMSTAGSAFELSDATLKGRLARPGLLFVGGLTAGTTYFFRLRGADPAGDVTEPSDAASGQTGVTTAGDYGTATIGTGAVSFNARTIGGVTNTVGSVAPSSPLQGDVWLDNSPGTAIIHKIYDGSSWVTNAWGSASIAAGQVTALQLAAGAVTAGAIAAGAVTTDKLTAGTITGFRINGGTISGGFISGGTVSGGFITGGTIEGTRFQTRAGNSRIRIDDDVTIPNPAGGTADAIEFFNDNTSKALIAHRVGVAEFLGVFCDSVAFYKRDGGPLAEAQFGIIDASEVNAGEINASDRFEASLIGVNPAFVVNIDGEVFSRGIEATTTGDAANVRVATSGSRQLLRSTSTIRLKANLAPLSDDLENIPADKLGSDPASVDPYDVLAVTATEFESLSPADNSARMLGFIAEDVAAKLPWAVVWDEDGLPTEVQDRPILAALLHVVKEQQHTITDLRTRIETLEAN